MIEALDKASAELDKTVRACIEQLTSSNEALEKSLRVQLQKVVDQSKNFVDGNVEDLTAHREELLDRLSEFERTEIETMMSAARDVRQQVATKGRQASESISKLVEEQMTELHTLIENPEKRFGDFANRGVEGLGRLEQDSKQKIEASESNLEQALTARAQVLDTSVQAVIAETKSGIEQTLEKYNAEMEEKITSVVNQLSDVVAKTLDELEQNARKGSKIVQTAGEAGKGKLVARLEDWKKDSDRSSDNFRNTITFEATSSQQSHSAKLERKVD